MKKERQGFKDSKVALSLEPDGWVLRLPDGREIRYSGDLLSSEFDRWLAEKLGISPAEAWKLKKEAIDQWWPRNLDEVRRLFPNIVGEDDNVKLLILAFFSLKLSEPFDRLMGVMIESSNSAGKSHFANEILKPMWELKANLELEEMTAGESSSTSTTYPSIILDFTRMTEAFLERRFQDQNLDRKILFLQEAKDAPAHLHITLSEGKLRVGLVEKVDGRFKPIEITCEGHPFLFLTTTNWSGSQDLVHRCIVINLDEGPEQTKKIIDSRTQIATKLSSRLASEKFAAGCVKMFRRLWEKTPENVIVVIPYLKLVAEKLKSAEYLDVKMRRDYNKLIALINASAVLFHKNRPVLVGEEDGLKVTVIVSTVEDLENVLPLVDSSMRQVLSPISEKERIVLQAMAENENEMGYFTYSELFKLTKIPSSTLRLKVIPDLESKGFVIVDRDGKTHRIMRAKKDYSIPDLRIDPAEAEKLIREGLNEILSRGYAFTNSQGSPETASIPENEPGDRVVSETTRSFGVFPEKPGEGFDSEKEPVERVTSDTTRSSDVLGEKEPESGVSRKKYTRSEIDDVEPGEIWEPGGLAAIPLEVGGRRIGRILLRTLDLDIELNVGPLSQEVEELLRDLKALYGEETVSASADGRVIRVRRNISGGEIALLASRIREKLASAIEETALTASGNAGNPSPRIITTTMKMLCEDCYLQLKRAGAIHRECGRPGALEVCHECRRALADHMVFIKIGEGGDGK